MNSDEFYKGIFGPYFLVWCQRLHGLAEMYALQGKTKLYFSTRAGYVLHAFFNAFIQSKQIIPSYTYDIFPISRLSAIKAGLGQEPLWTGQLCCGAFNDKQLGYFIARLGQGSRFININDYISKLPAELLQSVISPAAIKRWMDLDSYFEERGQIFNYFKYQKSRMDAIFDESNEENAIVVDSGLYGITVELLSGLYSKKNVIGAFVYHSNYNNIKPATHLSRLYGLMGAAQRPRFILPHSCVLRNWHLIEYLLEPKAILSVTEYTNEPPLVRYEVDNSRVASIINFITDNQNASLASSLKILNKMLANPSLSDIKLLAPERRKNDLNDEYWHVIIPHDLERNLRKRDKLRGCRYGIIKRSLWKEGQYTQSFGLFGRLVNSINIIKDIVY